MNWNARALSVLLCTTVGSLAQDAARQPEPWTKWDLATGDAIRVYSGHHKAAVCCSLNDSAIEGMEGE